VTHGESTIQPSVAWRSHSTSGSSSRDAPGRHRSARSLRGAHGRQHPATHCLIGGSERRLLACSVRDGRRTRLTTAPDRNAPAVQRLWSEYRSDADARTRWPGRLCAVIARFGRGRHASARSMTRTRPARPPRARRGTGRLGAARPRGLAPLGHAGMREPGESVPRSAVGRVFRGLRALRDSLMRPGVRYEDDVVQHLGGRTVVRRTNHRARAHTMGAIARLLQGEDLYIVRQTGSTTS
jgi:hypothetical protein